MLPPNESGLPALKVIPTVHSRWAPAQLFVREETLKDPHRPRLRKNAHRPRFRVFDAMSTTSFPLKTQNLTPRAREQRERERMAELEGFRRLLNPLVLNLQKMELELTCPICLKLLNMPRLLPCNHISCSSCVTISTMHGHDCPICKVPFHHQDLRPSVHVEIMVNIYKSMNSAVGAILTQRGEQVAISDTKMPSGGSPDFGDRNDEEKSEEEPIHNRDGEGSKYMQSHAPIFGNFRTGNPRCVGEKNEPAMNISKKDVQSNGVEAFLQEKKLYSPQSSGDQKESDYDSNDMGNEPRNGNDSCKRGSKVGTSQTGEDYIRDSKRQKLGNAVDVGDITGDVHAKEFSIFNSESVHEHQRCPNIKSLHTTVHDDMNGLFICAFCHSTRTTEASGPMLHYIDGKPVPDDQALQLNVLHVHQKCIEWAPQVFFVGETAVNLDAELARASKIKCSSCGLKGAALGCYVKSCRRSFHVPCAADIQDCRWDAENFLLLCPVHFSHKLPCERSKARKKTKANRSLCYSSSPGDLTSPTKPQSDKLWTASPSVTQEWLLCGSSLSNMEKDALNDFVSLTGASVTNTWKANVTHVIAATDEHGACSRTLKVLMAILRGKWVLNVEWLRACIKAGHPVPEEPHEISHDIHGAFDGPRNGRIRAMQKAPKLFTGLTFYFSGHFMPYYKDHLEDLIVAAAGTVLEKSEITPTTFIVYSTEPPQGSNSDGQHEVIKKRKEEAEDLAARIGSRAIPHTWLLDSIASCNIQLNL